MKPLKCNMHAITTNIESDIATLSNRQSIRIDTFLKSPFQYRNFRILRFGVESPNYETRSKLGKKFSDEELGEAMGQASKLGISMTLYFILGLDKIEEYQSFINIPQIATRKTLNTIVVNYLDCVPNTPFENFDLSRLLELDLKKLSYQLRVAHPVRFYSSSIKIENTIFRTILERAHWEDASQIWKLHTKFSTRKDLLNIMKKNGLYQYVETMPHKNLVVGFSEEKKKKGLLGPKDFGL